MKNRLPILVALVVLSLFVSACSAGAKLNGNAWELTAINGSAPISGTNVSLSFDEDGVAGSAGCNRYFGSYEVDGKKLSFGPLGSTRMACSEPEGVMEQEMRFLTLLGAAEGYKVKNGVLTITTAAGDTLTFAAEK